MKFLLVSFLFLIGTGLFSPLGANEDSNSACPFCDCQILNNQKFYEDELVMALLTHKPIFPGHSLIIPKRHVERFEELSDMEMLQIGRVIKKVNLAAEKVFGTSAYLLLQKNGKEVGQQVPHLHFHYIPRVKDDDSSLKFIFNMYTSNFSKPMNPVELKELARKMEAAVCETTPP